MATAGSAPDCGVCHKTCKYGGLVPYLLSCLHSVCEVCLYSDVDDAVFCSLCNEYFLKFEDSFPNGCHECLFQADAFKSCTECLQDSRKLRVCCPKDAVTAKVIFAAAAEHCSSELLCTNRNDGNQAMSWCQKCKAFLCEHCQASHEDMKVTRNHSIVLVKDLSLSDMEKHIALEHCTLHEGYLKKVYDDNCKILICYKCFKTVHKDFITKPLEEWMMHVKEEKFQFQVKALTEKMKQYTEMEQTIQGMETILNDKKKVVVDAVEHTFGEIKCHLDQREQELKSQLSLCVDILREENVKILIR